MDAELKAFMLLQELGLSVADGSTAVDTVLQLARDADRVLRPYRYQQIDGMRHAYSAWRCGPWLPSGVTEADILNAFQAGYTARGRGGK